MQISVNLAESVSNQMAIIREQFSGIITDLQLQDVEFTLGSSSGEIFDAGCRMQDVVDALSKPYRLYLYFDTGVDRPSYTHHLHGRGTSTTATARRSPSPSSDRHWLPTDRGRPELVRTKTKSYKQHLISRERSRSPRSPTARRSPSPSSDKHRLPTDRGRPELVRTKTKSYKQHLTSRERSRSPRSPTARRDSPSPSPDRYGLPSDGDGRGSAQDSDGSLSPAFDYDHTQETAVSPVTQPCNNDLNEPSKRGKLQQRGVLHLFGWKHG